MLLAGRALLILALAIALYGIAASLYGARSSNFAARRGPDGRAWIASGRRAVYALSGTLFVSFALLELAFLRSDLSFELVATHSSTTTPAFYRATAVWSSQEGSLLLWVVLLSAWSSAVLFITRKRAREIAPIRHRGAARAGRLLLRPADLPREPVRSAEPGPGGGHRAEPAAPPPEHDDPPPDAVLGLHAVRGAVRLRGRGARHPPARASSGYAPPARSPSRRGCASASAWCWARAGPTPSWAGAATGLGTASRTPR